ncbi:MAG: GNAT family N-acetyltransferase [Ilumatobacteraceae bacterium]
MITGLRQRRRDGLPRLLDDGRTRARLRPWPHEPRIAQLILTDHTKAPTVNTLMTWLGIARDHGFESVRTGALSDSATPPFVELGFAPIQRLALLRLELDRPNESLDAVLRHSSPRASRHELRAVRGSRQIATLARIDRAAFVDGWDLDASGIVDACQATPQHRVRLAVTADDEPAGYMITGRNGAAGFIQRLAVLPDCEGRGVASSLLIDGLLWLQRRRVDDVLVNTNFDNERALDLYRRFGFEPLDESLSVLALDGLAERASR